MRITMEYQPVAAAAPNACDLNGRHHGPPRGTAVTSIVPGGFHEPAL
jgi:hypothetical protein